MLIPSFLFSESAIECRKPLAPTARRAGWVGCNILLSRIPADGKIRIVEQGRATDAATVRRHFDRIRPLAELKPAARGWTLDVLAIVQGLGRARFSLADVYAEEGRLETLYPSNRNVRPKIRQQLQVLRDLGFVAFLGGGQYELAGARETGTGREARP